MIHYVASFIGGLIGGGIAGVIGWHFGYRNGKLDERVRLGQVYEDLLKQRSKGNLDEL